MGALRHQLGAQLDAAMEAPNGVRLEGWRDTLRARVAEEHVRGSSPFKSWVHHLQTHFQPTDFAAPTTLEGALPRKVDTPYQFCGNEPSRWRQMNWRAGWPARVGADVVHATRAMR